MGDEKGKLVGTKVSKRMECGGEEILQEREDTFRSIYNIVS